MNLHDTSRGRARAKLGWGLVGGTTRRKAVEKCRGRRQWSLVGRQMALHKDRAEPKLRHGHSGPKQSQLIKAECKFLPLFPAGRQTACPTSPSHQMRWHAK